MTYAYGWFIHQGRFVPYIITDQPSIIYPWGNPFQPYGG